MRKMDEWKTGRRVERLRRPRMSKVRKYLLAFFMAIGFGFISSCVGGGYVNVYEDGIFGKGNRTASTDTTSFVQVGELWSSTNKKFNANNFEILKRYIMGSGYVDNWTWSDYEYDYFTDQNAIDRSSAEMRSNTVSAGTQGSTSYTAKSSSQDIKVKLGGLNWQVVYLTDLDGTSTSYEHNVCVTLWLDNCQQDAWRGGNGQQGAYYGYSSSGFYSYYSYNYGSNYTTYPSNMYGTSYIRAVTLNNGGTYATSTTASATATQSTSSPFALYTMSQYGLTDYLVTPSEVCWQETQSAKNTIGFSYNLPNDAWSQDLSDDGFYSSRYNYAGKTGNDYWADDYLWLPSITETGYDTIYTGMWGTSTEQRKNYDGSTTSLTENAGSSNTDSYMYPNSWLRSGVIDSGYYAYNLYPSGSDFNVAYVDGAQAVRPALHLNLSLAESNTISDGVGNDAEVGEIWDDTNQRFNEDELNVLMKYVMGDNNTTISKIKSYVNHGGTVAGAWARTAEDMRNDAVSAGVQGDLAYDAKSSGSDIRVTLGGLKWEVVFLSKDTQKNPILTLWLDDCVQDAWTGRSSTEGAYYGFVNGGLYSDWSANWSDSSDPGGKAYPSNMYGTSYINAVTLNNGGKYATSTSASVTATQSSSSVFAKFTMSSVSKLTEYIVTPNYVAWQKDQSAVDQIGYPFNLSNDAWNTSLSSTNFYSTSYNYAYLNASAGTKRSGDNDAWRNSNLWLPSFTEVGGGNYTTSLWKPSVNQRNNNNGVYVSYSSVGSSNTNSYYCDLYLRSSAGNNANVAHTMIYNGKTANGTTVHNSCGVRPALHLNLNTAYLSASEDYVEVGEIYDEDTKSFDSDNVDILLKYILGDGQATFDSSASYRSTTLTKLSTYATNTFTPTGGTSTQTGFNAGAMREKRVKNGGTSGSTDYVAKTSGQDIVVTLGGLKWQVEYLSKDKDNNLILTLWLDNCQQDAWTSRSSTEGVYYGFLSGGLYSTYVCEFLSSYATERYPSNMYGTSYIHAVTLNNGGTYATSTTASATATQSTSSPFALYTMSQYGLTDYLVTPSEVSWQETQSAKNTIGFSYNLPNDAWSSSMTSGFYTDSTYGLMNYASKTGNDYWADDYLWLPSLTETGYNSTYSGLWQTSTSQRENYDGSSTGSLGSVGTGGKLANAESWLRSGNDGQAIYAYYLNSTSSSSTLYSSVVHAALAVRPALHLNLTAIANHSDSVEVGELYDEENVDFNETNISILYKYLTGDSSAKIADVNALATTVTSASDIRTKTLSAGTVESTNYAKKDGTQDIKVTLGGLKWEAVYLSKDDDGNTILTLWLDSAKQEKWETGTYSTVPYSSLSSGVYTSMWSAGWSDSAVTIGGYYSNLYSTSYISTEVLNNEGGYPTSGNNLPSFASSSTSNPFAMFTMSQYGLLDYLVLPNYVSWQIEQYAIDILGNTYNLPNESIYSDDSGFYSSEFNYSNYAHDYIDMHPWGDCYLWLPSLSEVGITTANNGLWGTSKSQRFDINSGKNTWLRSGAESSASTAYTLYAKKESTYKANVGSYFAGVRPALHLNLTAIEEKFDSDKIPITGDLYNRTDGTVNKTNLNILYRYLTGSSSGTLATVNSQITSGGGAIDSKVLREKSLVAGSYGSTSYNKKKSGDDITVTLAGLTWKAVYLSTDANGNTILTLWMDGYQEEWKDKAIGSTYHTVSNGVMYSKWSAGWSSSSISGTYVSNIYGTSYMNAVTLDNTGTLAQSITAGKNSTVRYASSNNLYYFTNNTNLRNNYLVTPSVMGWQGTQSAISLQDTEWNQPNEGYNVTDGFYFNGSLDMNFSSKTNNDAWKNSYLWLPSLSEVGYGDGSNQKGLFNTSTTLRANTITSKAPVAGLDNAYSFTWTRSGCMYNADTVYAISPDGSSARVSYNVGAFAFVVRPCVHLNLTAMNA